ncbi:MAG: hypothetical protein AAF950_06890 [Pseudomonadota bacterium]
MSFDPRDHLEYQKKKWRTRLSKEPEIAGWYIDCALMNEWERAFNHPVFHVIAEKLGKNIEDVDFLALDPYEAVKVVMPKKLIPKYDWSKFENARDPENEGLPFNPNP